MPSTSLSQRVMRLRGVVRLRSTRGRDKCAMAHNLGPTSQDNPRPRLPRPALRIKAFLEDHCGRRRVLITEYSQYGLSLGRVAGAELDERVTVELRVGRSAPDASGLGEGCGGGCALPRPYSRRAPRHAFAR
jgi:hypothetical protein